MAKNVKPGPDAVVGLHQRGNTVLWPAASNQPRRAAGSGLELIVDHAVSAARGTLGHRSCRARLECCNRMLGGDEHGVDVVEDTVVGLGDNRHRPGVVGAAEMFAVMVEH